MNLNVSQEKLSAAINLAQRAVPSRSPLPVLGGLLLDAAGERLMLTGSDLELWISVSVPAEVAAPGRVVIPARYLADIVRRLPDGPVQIESVSDGAGAVLRYGGAEARLSGFPAEEYPELPEVTPRASFSLPAEVCREIARQVAYAAGKDDLRAIFTGVLMEIADGNLCLVATDTHRLALKRYQLPDGDTELTNVIIPARAVNELHRAVAGLEGEVAVQVAVNYITFASDSVRIVSRLIDGTYPDYRRVIPESHLTRVRSLDGAAFLRAVERAAVFAQEDASVVRCEVEGEIIRVSSQSEVGGLEETLPAQVEGETVSVAFNAAYLMDALRAARLVEVDMEFNGSLGPAVIRPAGANDHLALILPMRLT